MGHIEFKNMDNEWEEFPTAEELQIIHEQDVVAEPEHPEVTTICHFCNEPFPMEQIVVTGGSLATGYIWSCPKCHAVSSIGKA